MNAAQQSSELLFKCTIIFTDLFIWSEHADTWTQAAPLTFNDLIYFWCFFSKDHNELRFETVFLLAENKRKLNHYFNKKIYFFANVDKAPDELLNKNGSNNGIFGVC